MSVARRGAGCGGRVRAKDVSRRAEAQAAAARATDRGSAAEDKNGGPTQGTAPPGCRRASLTHRARNAGHRRSVVTMLVWTSLPFPHEAAGRLRARRSARPWVFQGKECETGLRACPRRHNNRAGGALIAVIARTARRSRSRTKQSIPPRSTMKRDRMNCFAALAMTGKAPPTRFAAN
jgi:hypothetical protein